MFEGICLIIFFIIGGLAALLAVFFLVMALVRQSKRMFKVGLILAIIPLSLYALTYWFYNIHIPNSNKQQEKAYAGTYVMITSIGTADKAILNMKQPRLILNMNNTFQLDKNEVTLFYGKGTWKAGATDDGQFEFKDNNNSIVFWATPSNNNKLEMDKNFSDRQHVVFVK